jgi:S1-C subfamily serine protease
MWHTRDWAQHDGQSRLNLLGIGLVLWSVWGSSSWGGDDPVPPAPALAKRLAEKAGPANVHAGIGRGKGVARDQVLEIDDWTFRPTVLVRRGTSQGSGTIIASLDGETLVLTAAHVIRGKGPITLELHRYNLGLEHSPNVGGRWPRPFSAEVVGTDSTADIAIVRVRKLVGLPFVARLAAEAAEPAVGTDLTSVGIDLGSKLSSWNTRLVETLWFELNDNGTDRPFLVTERIPEHGRSGGGLFDRNGRMLGVCIGHAELVKGKRMGVFSSVENVRDLLRNQMLTSVIDRSEARARIARGYLAPSRRLAKPSASAFTSTGAKGDPAPAQP